MSDSTFPKIFALEVSYSGGSETLYFVPTNPGQIRVFIDRSEKIEEITDLRDRKMNWNRAKKIYLSELSDRQKQELMTRQGLIDLLEQT